MSIPIVVHGFDYNNYQAAIGGLSGPVDNPQDSQLRIRAAPGPCPNRPFVYAYAYDGQGRAAHVNLPFFVVG